jgi:hypothetical protein
MNSRQKGARGEREAAKVIAETFGCEARRGCQFAGGKDSPDVQTTLDGLHFEVKRVQRLNIHGAIDQAVNDAGEKVPCVLHRRDRTEWLLTVRLSDVTKLAARLAEALGKEDAGLGE